MIAKLTAQEKQRLVEALTACPCMEDSLSRKAVLQQLEPAIAVGIPDAPQTIIHIFHIVNACLQHADGLKQLIEAVRFFDRDKLPMRNLDAVFAEIFGTNAGEAGQGPGAHTPKTDIYRLPEPACALEGREVELARLSDAFKSPETRIAVLFAGGGTGKSALSDAWLNQLKPAYGGMQRVLAWSFYSQGSHSTANSSAPFFQFALPFFGAEIPKDEVDKGRALADCLQRRPGLLVLDGLEPLQHPPHIMDGQIADVALKEFIRCLRRLQQNSFVLISSRQPLEELQHWPDRAYLQISLETLLPATGARVLKKLGAQGLSEELEQASAEMGGHGLSLVLLAHLLKARFQGDVRRRDCLPALFEDARYGGHALRVLRYYDRLWTDDLKNPAQSNKDAKGENLRTYASSREKVKKWFTHGERADGEALERIFLRLLGLFDRPMEWREKQVLFDKAEYARPLAALDADAQQGLEKHLEEAGLLLKIPGNGERLSWDAHPLIRDYFGRSFREQEPKIYRQAQAVLFEYYQSVPDKKQPDTLEELEPLYRAVVHGCLAGEYKKAWEDVFQNRILRDNEGYTSKLGAYARDLMALSAFFPAGWETPVRGNLSEAEQGWLLAETSYCLMSLERLVEAATLGRAAIKIHEKLEDWEQARISAGNLTDLFLPLGELREATQAARQAVSYAERTNEWFQQMISRSKLAATLRRQGDLTAALREFEAAEALQLEHQFPYYPRLYSLQGARYCILLLDRAPGKAAREVVLERGRELFVPGDPLLDIALAHLIVALALIAIKQTDADARQPSLAQGVTEKSVPGPQFSCPPETSDASKIPSEPASVPASSEKGETMAEADEIRTELDAAVWGIHKAGKVQYTPEFLLTRARFYHGEKNTPAAWRDLDAAWEIIERCGMKLYAADAHILTAELKTAELKTEEARLAYEEARALVERTGYHLRDAELEMLAARLVHHGADLPGTPAEHLQKARQRIESAGHFGLLPALERLECFIN
ncbi:MAG: hypothetical protein GY862_28685 [Gammaproteobacteria bacterium]|nr:hypothetical protein [Gammaproteobacteria bacterium]